jgi:hypothetical protein
MREQGMSNKGLVVVALLMLFSGIAVFRLANLRADAPFGISVGQELSTDPPQYTSFARNKILFGEWEVFYTRYILFVKNITTLVAYPVFKIFGTGRAQSNLVAAILNFLTIFICFLIWKKRGYSLAIAGATILGFNYVFLLYGKQTFLEVTTISLISIGSYFLLSDNNRIISAIISGVFFSAAAFFSKLLAIVFLPLALAILLLELYQSGQSRIFKRPNPLYLFLIGYLGVFIIWLFLVYFPSKRDVSGYIAEFSTGMYGLPIAFESLKLFFVQLFSYGFDIKLWSKQPITFAAGFMGAAALGGMYLAPKKDFLKKLDRIDLFFLLWFSGMFITLFPWNYRPLRYALLIFPPMCYLAARWILMIADPPDKWGPRNISFYIIVFIAGAIISFHLLITPHFDERSMDLIYRYIPSGIMCGAVISFLGYFIHRYQLKKYLFSRSSLSPGKVTVAIILISIIIIQITCFFGNYFKNQETIYNASVDLGKILSPDAVVIGPYSSALTQSNHLRSIIKMFGVPVIEKDFFNKVPATHIAVESGGGETSNEGRAFRDYPNVMKNAPIVATYYLRGYPVNIYLISQNSPNPAARTYKPSLYEQAAIEYSAGKMDSAMIKLEAFDRYSSITMSTEILKMRIFIAQGKIQDAITQLEKVIKYDKGNLNLWLMLGDAYLKSNPPDLNMGYAAYKKALSIQPDNKLLMQKVDLLRNYLK